MLQPILLCNSVHLKAFGTDYQTWRRQFYDFIVKRDSQIFREQANSVNLYAPLADNIIGKFRGKVKKIKKIVLL